MEIDIELGENFLREVIRAALRDVTNLLIPGSTVVETLIEHIGVPFCAAGWIWLQRLKIPQQQRAIDGLTKIPVDRARVIAEAELGTYNLSPDKKAELASYLSVVPMTARRAISRTDDGGTPTTLLSQLPQTSSDILRFLPLRPPRFQPGDQVPGHDYRVQLLLGQGGFAEVWKADHIFRKTQPPVALKFCLDPKLLISLETEIRVLDKLNTYNHPEDFVRLYDTAYSSNPPFLVYEYVDGGDLVSWLASFGGKPPSVQDVVRVLKIAARALAFAHSQGIVHRDLKPSNLLVTRQGRIKISDFGIGAILATAEAHIERYKSVTGATLLQGAHTPLYTDPMKMLGKSPDPKDDVYALGVIAYQLLTGDVARRMGPGWRSDLAEHNIPSNLLDILAVCVDVPSKRLRDGGELLASLNDLVFGESQNKVDSNDARVAINYCSKCRAKVHMDDRFCTKCGYRLK